MGLGVGLFEVDVAQAVLLAEPTGSCQPLDGSIDAYRAPENSGPGGLASGEPGAAADVEHVVIGSDRRGRLQPLVIATQFGVVVERSALVFSGHGRTVGRATAL